VRFEKPATLVVRLSDVEARYRGRLRVGVADDGGPNSQVAADAEGRATLSTLQPGEVTIRVLLDDASPLQVVTLRLGSGVQEHTVAVPALYAVRFQNVLSGSIFLSPAQQDPHRPFLRHADTDGAQEIVIDGLPAGEYRVHAGKQRATFRVPGTAVVRLE
jgi:hypothetical protein